MIQFVLISGLSGAGKSIALHTLEDCSFYCIDNLPIELLADLINKRVSGEGVFPNDRVAVSIGVPSLESSNIKLESIVEALHEHNINTTTLFLSANTPAITQRYNETRRPHPMATYEKNKTIEHYVEKERDLLNNVAAIADSFIDTSDLTPLQLRERVAQSLCHTEETIHLSLQSFGYKRGLPPNSDYVFDVRSLPNPYWDAELRSHSGIERPIIHFMEAHAECKVLTDSICHFLTKALEGFDSTTRNYITVSIGCTGGYHRSVYIVEQVYARLSKEKPLAKWNIHKQHRDLTPSSITDS